MMPAAKSGKGGVEDAIAGANAALAAASEDLPEESLIERWSVGDPDARRQVVIAGGREGLRNAGIAGHQQPGRRARIERGLRSGDLGLKLVVLLPPGHNHVPAQAGVDSKVAAHAPTILRIQTRDSDCADRKAGRRTA